MVYLTFEIVGLVIMVCVIIAAFRSLEGILKEYGESIDEHTAYIDANLDKIVEIMQQHIADEKGGENNSLDFDGKF